MSQKAAAGTVLWQGLHLSPEHVRLRDGIKKAMDEQGLKPNTGNNGTAQPFRPTGRPGIQRR
jgi:hypothetical protein